MRSAALPYLALSLLLGSLPSATAELKIATVNMEKIWTEFWRSAELERQTKETDALIKRQLGALEEKHKALSLEVQNLAKEFRKLDLDSRGRLALSKELEQKGADLKANEQDLRGYRQAASGTMEGSGSNPRERIFIEIQRVVESHAKSGNYDFVFDISGQMLPPSRELGPWPKSKPHSGVHYFPVVRAYTKPGDDLTMGILEELNRSRPKEIRAKDAPQPNSPAPKQP